MTEEHKRKVMKNLRPCKPGETHNPSGRPKLPKELRLEMLNHIPMLNTVVLSRALKGDMRAAKIYYDRVMPTVQSIEYTDTKDDIKEDLSGFTDEQLKQRMELKDKLKSITPGGADSGSEAPGV